MISRTYDVGRPCLNARGLGSELQAVEATIWTVGGRKLRVTNGSHFDSDDHDYCGVTRWEILIPRLIVLTRHK